MARAKVEQVQCDRCKRVELVPLREDRTGAAVMTLTFKGAELKYEDLCPRCETAVGRLIEDIKQWEREVKQEFLGPQVSQNQAAPMQVPPILSPPQPHSAAAAKR
jgi:hypothetical protein